MNDLQQVCLELHALEVERDALVIDRNSEDRLKLKSDRVKYKISGLNNKLLQKLKASNKEVAAIEKTGLHLLENANASVVVSKTGSYFFGHFTNKIQGRLHKNGYMYGASDTPVRQHHRKIPTIKAFLFGHDLVPVSYTGYVNVFGGFNLKVNEFKKLLDHSECPKRIQVSIRNDGRIYGKVDAYEKSGETVYKVIFDPFGGDGIKRTAFLENRTELLHVLDDIRKSACVNSERTWF